MEKGLVSGDGGLFVFSYGLKVMRGWVLVFRTAFLPKSGWRMFLMEYFRVWIVGSSSSSSSSSSSGGSFLETAMERRRRFTYRKCIDGIWLEIVKEVMILIRETDTFIRLFNLTQEQ